MKIVCDRCEKNVAEFEKRSGWTHIEISEKGYGKTGDYYLCKDCSSIFFSFLDNKAGGEND